VRRLELAAVAVGGASLLAWLSVLVRPDRPWDLLPSDDLDAELPEPRAWPEVSVVVPARDEAAVLEATLPALLAQDYPGDWRIVLVDDRSADDTAGLARSLADARLTVVDGSPLPQGWTGKVWALEQGAAVSGDTSTYLLLTDADIRHTRGSLRRLVAESEALGLALNSRMARLSCASLPERLLVPPFLFFFNLLYPMRRVNDPARRLAAAAGGCVLVRRDVLARAGGFTAIRGELIDDVALAKRLKATGASIRLSVSRAQVASVREYGSLGAVWRMVRRTAFDQLGYSWFLLLGTLAGLALLFLVPPALVVAGAARSRLALALGLSAWMVSAVVFLPTIRYFRLSPAWAAALPAAGTLYGGMTLDSALRHARGLRGRW
jgi:hopene-associated glycosyltransferase HpnB